MSNDLNLAIFFDQNPPRGQPTVRIHALGLTTFRRFSQNLTTSVQEL